jgi:hypothetical protein
MSGWAMNNPVSSQQLANEAARRQAGRLVDSGNENEGRDQSINFHSNYLIYNRTSNAEYDDGSIARVGSGTYRGAQHAYINMQNPGHGRALHTILPIVCTGDDTTVFPEPDASRLQSEYQMRYTNYLQHGTVSSPSLDRHSSFQNPMNVSVLNLLKEEKEKKKEEVKDVIPVEHNDNIHISFP